MHRLLHATRIVCFATAISLLGPAVVGAQVVPTPAAAPVAGWSLPVDATAMNRGGEVSAWPRITDPRLEEALVMLVNASPTAARVLDGLAASGLPVAIGTPAQLAALPEAGGGLGAAERRHLLAPHGTRHGLRSLPIAEVVIRAGGAGVAEWVERVWITVEVDSVRAMIGRAGHRDVDVRLRLDLMAILAHEFVAHVGSIAESRRVDDLCEDPNELQRRRSAEARARGELPPLDGEMSACSLRVENRVRRELNRALALRGDLAFPQRLGYSLDTMHFAAGMR